MNPCIEITEHEDLREIRLPLKPKQLQQLQKNDTYCRDIAKKLHKDTELQKIFIKEEGVLYRLCVEDGRTFKCILVPQVLQDFMIILAHDYSGHNGSRRTYNCLKRQYYWPVIRKQIFRHCKRCKECVLQNQGQPEKCFGHFGITNGVHLHGLGGTYSPTQQQRKQIRADSDRYVNRIYHGSAYQEQECGNNL